MADQIPVAADILSGDMEVFLWERLLVFFAVFISGDHHLVFTSTLFVLLNLCYLNFFLKRNEFLNHPSSHHGNDDAVTCPSSSPNHGNDDADLLSPPLYTMFSKTNNAFFWMERAAMVLFAIFGERGWNWQITTLIFAAFNFVYIASYKAYLANLWSRQSI